MRESPIRKILAVLGLLIALFLLRGGLHQAYSVYPDPSLQEAGLILPEMSHAGPSMPGMPPGMPAPPPIPQGSSGPIELKDWQLVENATFTGVVRREGKLFFTYDPSQERGKRSCPT